MKSFFKQYGYTCVTLFVNQFAISIFGAVLAMTTTAMGNDAVTIGVSVFAILFFIFLIYNVMWTVGAKDRLSFDLGKKKKSLQTGLLIALVANIPNLLIALVYTVGYPFMSNYEWAGNICAAVKVIGLFIEGMYSGLITAVTVGGVQLSYFWWTYFLITVPTIASIWISYLIGFSNFKFFPSFSMHSTENKKNQK